MYLSNASPVTISNNRIYSNGGVGCAQPGGGIRLVGNSNAQILYNSIYSNTSILGNTSDDDSFSGGDGGGINIDSNHGQSEAAIRYNLIYDNIAMRGGGVAGSNIDFQNNTVYGNSAFENWEPWGGAGGGYDLGNNITILNDIITGNYAEDDWPVSHGIYGGEGTINYSLVDGGFGNSGLSGSNGNISGDPMFVSPGFDFNLNSNSPCIDAGAPYITDPDGTISDVGALYYNQAVNDAPVIDAISDPSAILEDAGSQTINLTGIGDGDAEVTQTIAVTATSSNTSLIPNPTVTYTSDNSTGSLSYTPVSNANGSAVITVTVTDNGGTANGGVNSFSTTFSVHVLAVNDEPSFTKGPDITVLEDSGTSTTTGWATSIVKGPSNESGQTLTFTVSNDNNSLFSSQTAISSSGNLTFTPASNANGAATVTVSLSDDGGTSNGGDDTYANQTFTITVTAVNDAPVIDAISDPSAILEDAGSQTMSLTGIGDGDAEVTQTIAVTATSSNTSLIPNPTVTYTPSGATGSLAYTPVSNANGSAVITVTVTDNGGTANSGVNSRTRTFTVAVTAVNDAPVIDAISDPSTILEDASAQTINLTGIGDGDADVTQTIAVTATSDNTNLIPNPTVTYTSDNSTGSLAFTPVSNANGSAVITVQVTDDGGTANSGVNTTITTFTVNVTDVNDDIYGCTDSGSCNYNPNANIDDGSCEYEDCAGECGGNALEDCYGVCNGSAQEDNCGVCGGDSECFSGEQVVIFEYTGSVQEYIMPLESSNLTLEVWGAQGEGSDGGMGGYIMGDVTEPFAGQTLNIYVGAQDGWNGGGTGYGSNPNNGGGASDIRLNGGSMSDRIIVAGAGGGSKCCQDGEFGGGAGGSGDCGVNYCGGGGGDGWCGGGDNGGYYGGEAQYGDHCGGGGGGGYQSGGHGAFAGYGQDNSGQDGTFGYGGDGSSNFTHGNCQTSGGGAGYYGGGGSSTGHCGGGGGGGGSSWAGDLANISSEGGVNEGNGLVKITYNIIVPYIFSFDQQIIRGETVEVPIFLHPGIEIDGLTFAVDVSPNGGTVSISEDLSIESIIPGSYASIYPTGDGKASVLLSNLGLLSYDDLIVANLIIYIPESTQNGDTYSLSFTSVTGTTADYEDVVLQDFYNITLNVITAPPVFEGIEDVYLLENSSIDQDFSIIDLDGTEITLELEGPDYVTLDFNSTNNSGTIDISPGFGAESGIVTLTATNSEAVPEITIISFNIYINHYPILTPIETVYIIEGMSTSFDVILTDIDGDSLSLELESAPNYVTYTPYDNVSGLIEIATVEDNVSGDVIFDITDNGTPPALTSSGFSVSIHEPQILGLNNFHIPKNNVLDTLITFYNFDEGALSFEVLESPTYLNYDIYGDNEGLMLSISPNNDDVSSTFSLGVSSSNGLNIEQSVS